MTIVEDAMTDALARLRAEVTRDDVLRAIQEYDQLGPERCAPACELTRNLDQASKLCAQVVAGLLRDLRDADFQGADLRGRRSDWRESV
jgi:hypothetical protein